MTESALDITILLDDQDLIRLVATWPKLTKGQREDEVFIAQAANIMRSQVAAVVLRAKIHGLVYEDGRINSFAEKYLSGLVGVKIAELQKRTKKA